MLFRTIQDARAAGPFSFEQLDRMLGSRTSARLPGRWTTLVRTPHQSIAVQYTNTKVVEWFRCGRVRIDSGGWWSVTTKNRINTYAPVSVWQNFGEWYVCWGYRFSAAGTRTTTRFTGPMDWKAGQLLGR